MRGSYCDFLNLKGLTMLYRFQRFTIICLSVLFSSGLLICAYAEEAEKVNPYQEEIDKLNNEAALINAKKTLVAAQKELAAASNISTEETALITAKKTLADAQAAYEKAQSPGFGAGFGKSGALAVGQDLIQDKFHVTVRTAESFPIAAKQLAAALSGEDKPAVLLGKLDREALPIFYAAKVMLDELKRKTKVLADQKPLLNKENLEIFRMSTPFSVSNLGAFSMPMLGAGAFLSQLAQFTQLFRTDKTISFVDSGTIPDELLLDLVAMEAKDKILYPYAAIDSLLTGQIKTEFDLKMSVVSALRDQVEKMNIGDKRDLAKPLLDEINAFMTSMTTPDATTKMPAILTVMRGELADKYLQESNGKMLAVNILIKGGANLKTSSIWRSDQIYASGGVAVTYRLISGGAKPAVLKAGVITTETKFTQIPLN